VVRAYPGNREWSGGENPNPLDRARPRQAQEYPRTSDQHRSWSKSTMANLASVPRSVNVPQRLGKAGNSRQAGGC